jgi:N-acetylmuramoyl-L-alanine amidase
MRLFISVFSFFITATTLAQKPTLRINRPDANINRVSRVKQYVEGVACKTCEVTVNNNPVKVYATGAFATAIELLKDSSNVQVKVRGEKGDTVTRNFTYIYTKPKGDSVVKTFSIASVETFPDGNLLLMAGDKIKFKVKAQPGSSISVANVLKLNEQKGGYYSAEYKVKTNDALLDGNPLNIVMKDASGKTFTANTKAKFTLLKEEENMTGKTIGKLPALLEGLGEDRLGGPKMGYLDTGVVLKIVGKVRDKYKVKLSDDLKAYIDDEFIELLPSNSWSAESLTGSISIKFDAQYEYINIPLTSKLPYRSFQRVNPSKIVVDIFGATSNSNWIIQPDSLQEVKTITYETPNDETFRMVIDLAHQQHWGHSIYYIGNTLVVRIKKQPASLELKDLIIGVDAGHGGSNDGATGIAGTREKDMTLLMAQEVRYLLEAENATVAMTRLVDESFENKERLLFFNKKKADVVLSIHMNSADNSVDVKGTSTYYKHIGYRPLTQFIYKRILELGLKGFGNIGNFNFILNSQTDQPNCLVETMFVSHPEDEAKMLDPTFRKELAKKIVQGLKDWLNSCKGK